MTENKNAGVTEDTSYHTGNEPGNMGMAWYKKDFSEELRQLGAKIKRSVESGYRLPNTETEGNLKMNQ